MQQNQILEGADAFELGEGPVGVLLLHGFTGCPQSLRGLGEFLAERQLAVSAPLLPGHGTTWQDLDNRKGEEWAATADAALAAVSEGRDEIFVVGLSFGAAVAVDLIARHPDRVRGLVTLSGFLWTGDPRARIAPLLARIVRSAPGVANDIAEPGVREIAYDRLPARAAAEMLSFCRRARAGLKDVRCPALVIHSRRDHTSPPRNAEIIAREIASSEVEVVWLDRSYHVITLDYDRRAVFDKTFDFIRERSSHAL